ncbi:MAG: hypothetical protein JJ920_04620 [Roseitalea sp.]|jgi:hypothetical protein|nr:hypothetical protein [Roseitalea sp.]MBO6723866.1 hypothetical protein [Roseitalea sp.]MBO6742172.1 hypothetical protein [Roseitalea sp.]
MQTVDRTALDASLVAAHEDGDPARLSALYERAANALTKAGDTDAACFFLTQAYVFALEAGAPRADDLKSRLKAHGRI